MAALWLREGHLRPQSESILLKVTKEEWQHEGESCAWSKAFLERRKREEKKPDRLGQITVPQVVLLLKFINCPNLSEGGRRL